MTTIQNWIDEVRYYLDGDRSEDANILASNYAVGGTSLTFSYDMGNIGPGSILSAGTNTFRVTSVSAANKTATVIPGFQSSTDANVAAGTMVRVNPRFTDHRILRALNTHLASLSSPSIGLYKVGSTILAFDMSVQGYDLAGIPGLIRVLEVRRDVTGTSQAWVPMRPGDWSLQRSAPVADFPSGTALRINLSLAGSPSWAPFPITGISVFNVQVVYATTFTATETVTSDVTVTGIPATAEDIPPLGAALRLMSGREVSRNATHSQGDTRRAQEVPPGAVAASYRGLAALWGSRVAEESSRLRAAYPLTRA